ncbi:MAG: hypothetical protein HY611_05490, partial [Elusimicrobia bacterium]|nr:hypothetical protein [Elusimicrobiota bacterium]
MQKINEISAFLHRAVLLFLAAFAVPALLVFLLPEMGAGAAGVMERLAPAWGWLMNLWFLSAAYFCGCLIASSGFRENLLARISGFRERDEREELVTAKAARSMFLLTLGCFITAGLAGMIRFNIFSFTRWEGGAVPPLVKVGPYELRQGHVAKKGLIFWPSLGIPKAPDRFPEFTELEHRGAQYYYESGAIFAPEVS